MIATESPIPAGSRQGRRSAILAWLVILALASAHAWGCLLSFGGWAELTGPWPIAFHDHPLQFHAMRVGSDFLARSGTTAGYDPAFMAGYPSSILYPQSATLFQVVRMACGGGDPGVVYKLTVFVALVLLPWLMALAGFAFGLGAVESAWASLALMIFVWSDGAGAGFPLNYAFFGMVSYLLSMPLALVTNAAIAAFLRRGGFLRGELAFVLASVALMVHVSSPIILAPAALTTYAVAIRSGRRAGRPLGIARHLGFWLIPLGALAVNAFWWWPGIVLREMLGDSRVAFVHPEPVWVRMLQIVTQQPPIQVALYALLVPGLIVLTARNSIAGASLVGFAAAGFGWGFLAGAARQLDFLQPGRQTYALYLVATIAAGVALGEIGRRLRDSPGRLPFWLTLGIMLAGVRYFGPGVHQVLTTRLGGEGRLPYLSSKPTPLLSWIVETLKAKVRPGERILYEESGIDLEGVPDPYQGRRFSGLLPHLAGVEVIGGPYLKAALKTNFTQFGAGKLFGRDDWDLEFFDRYSRIYRPAAIVCYSPQSIRFCRSHPQIFEELEEFELNVPAVDEQTKQTIAYPSRVLFAKIKGYGGVTIRGRAEVKARSGSLTVSGAEADELDGLVVLRYHFVPELEADPSVGLEPVLQGDDPVPFIGVRPPARDFELRLDILP